MSFTLRELLVSVLLEERNATSRLKPKVTFLTWNHWTRSPWHLTWYVGSPYFTTAVSLYWLAHHCQISALLHLISKEESITIHKKNSLLEKNPFGWFCSYACPATRWSNLHSCAYIFHWQQNCNHFRIPGLIDNGHGWTRNTCVKHLWLGDEEYLPPKESTEPRTGLDFCCALFHMLFFFEWKRHEKNWSDWVHTRLSLLAEPTTGSTVSDSAWGTSIQFFKHEQVHGTGDP